MFYVHSSTLHEADGRHRAQVCLRQNPPPGILKASAPVRLRQYPHQGTESQCTSDSSQYPPLGIPKASRPVRLCIYPPPEIRKASLQSAFAIIPHQGYRKPVVQSACASIPHQGYRKPVLQTAFANNLTWLRK
ncbi:hypothetical protein PoB_005882000 [Plakobranchus ocellatus]|uniref:Uncharacterized protein n=1 Tax=Plakobranchus ocellatus TaxID=259542 RepID=A0AAV4CKD1_9GAST|nr:hypothetical protein PoB_005882000 [Plakobranchus ocellatus]